MNGKLKTRFGFYKIPLGHMENKLERREGGSRETSKKVVMIIYDGWLVSWDTASHFLSVLDASNCDVQTCPPLEHGRQARLSQRDHSIYTFSLMFSPHIAEPPHIFHSYMLLLLLLLSHFSRVQLCVTP